MLSVKNLKAKIGEKEILNGINLQIAGKVHAAIGSNDSEKAWVRHLVIADL